MSVNAIQADYYRAQNTRKTTNSSDVSFLDALTKRQAESTSGQSFEEMLKARYPGMKYHALDTSKIDPEIWRRHDYPFENYFEDDLDESILDWKPTGPAPSDLDKSVQDRMNATIGKKAIIVPPALQEKMAKDPAFAKSVMARVDAFIARDEALATTPLSVLIALDEKGEISQCRVTSQGHWIGPSERELLEAQAHRKAKQEQKDEYDLLLERMALKRMLEMMAHPKHDQPETVQNRKKEGNTHGAV
jgi:hypothetical protein